MCYCRNLVARLVIIFLFLLALKILKQKTANIRKISIVQADRGFSPGHHTSSKNDWISLSITSIKKEIFLYILICNKSNDSYCVFYTFLNKLKQKHLGIRLIIVPYIPVYLKAL